MPTATLDRPSFPKTVTACHAEIIRLRVEIENIEDADDGNARIDELETEVEELQKSLKAAEAEKDELEKRIESEKDPGWVDNYRKGINDLRSIHIPDRRAEIARWKQAAVVKWAK